MNIKNEHKKWGHKKWGPVPKYNVVRYKLGEVFLKEYKKRGSKTN